MPKITTDELIEGLNEMSKLHAYGRVTDKIFKVPLIITDKKECTEMMTYEKAFNELRLLLIEEAVRIQKYVGLMVEEKSAGNIQSGNGGDKV
jgi:hypothetical protein